MTEPEAKNNGGWLADANRAFDNARDFYATETFRGMALDTERLDYFRDYLGQYFNMRFVHGWGTEDILDALAAVPRAGDWLDVGAGTSSLLWAIPLREVESVTCCDLVPEALAVLEDFVQGAEVPQCYADVLDIYGLTAADLAARRARFGRYLVFDAFSPWPEAVTREGFDLITAIGNFGLSPDAEAYKRCFGRLRPALKPGGRVVGADWVRSAAFIAEEGHDNAYVCEALARDAAVEHGFDVISCRHVAIQGDPLYDAVVVWSLSA